MAEQEQKDNIEIPIVVGVYEHWKGGLYQVLFEAVLESDGSPYVVYHPIKIDSSATKNYIRSKADFFAPVEKEGVLVPRFKIIDSPKIITEQKSLKVDLKQTFGEIIPQ